jgi:hypothetical protein
VVTYTKPLPTSSEQSINNYIIRGSHIGPFKISVPRQSVALYYYHLHHIHHHHHYNLNKVCTMTRLHELRVFVFQVHIPHISFIQIYFQKMLRPNLHTPRSGRHLEKLTISPLVMKFPTFIVTRRFAAKPPAPANSQLSPVHILALLFVSVLPSYFCVIFQVYTSL